MDIEGKIRRVEFSPNNNVKIFGLAFSKHMENRIVGSNEFEMGWFWFNDLPEPVADVLTKVHQAGWIDLQTRNIVPKNWPAGLGVEPQSYPFNFDIQAYSISNPLWESDVQNSIQLKISSGWHMIEPIFPEHDIMIRKDLVEQLFVVLDENL